MGSLFNLDHLTSSEITTARVTQQEIQGFVDNFHGTMEVFFKVPYFTGTLEPVSTELGAFQSFCREHYLQAPYTFWTIFDTWLRGYYLEGLILYRHLLEGFIQMRYFQKYPEKLEGYITGKGRVRFITMFDEFCPGYYHRFYGRQLSVFAHGKVGKSIFRVDRKSPTEGRIIMGCEYNEEYASYVMNSVLVLVFGFLNTIDLFFPSNTLSESEIKTDWMNAKSWLEESMKLHKAANERSIQLYEHMDKIIYY